MLENYIIKKIIWTTLFIFGVGIIVFGVYAFFDWHLLVGWIFGGLIGILGYILSAFLINISVKKVRSKLSGFWFGFLRTQVHLLVHTVAMIGVMFVNTYSSGDVFQVQSFFDLVNPINLFTYVGGISIVMISTLIAHIPQKRR